MNASLPAPVGGEPVLDHGVGQGIGVGEIGHAAEAAEAVDRPLHVAIAQVGHHLPLAGVLLAAVAGELCRPQAGGESLRAGEISALRVGSLDPAGTHRPRGALGLDRQGPADRGRAEDASRPADGIHEPGALRAATGSLRRPAARPAGYVFASAKGGPLNYGTFYSLHFKPTVRAVLPERLHGLRFHDLRHTFASLLVEQGAHPKEMAELMGHSSVQITLDRYSHVMPRLTAALADRIDAAYRAAEPAPSSSVAQRTTTVLLRDGVES